MQKAQLELHQQNVILFDKNLQVIVFFANLKITLCMLKLL